jgi:Tfp pilus assembly protein PilV
MSRRRGFNLLEILFSVFLFGLALLGLVQAYIYSIGADRGGRQREDISGIASRVMAETEAAMRRSPAQFQLPHARPRAAWPDTAGVFYQVDEQSVSSSLKQITVTVTYSDSATHQQRDYRLWALVRNFHSP